MSILSKLLGLDKKPQVLKTINTVGQVAETLASTVDPELGSAIQQLSSIGSNPTPSTTATPPTATVPTPTVITVGEQVLVALDPHFLSQLDSKLAAFLGTLGLGKSAEEIEQMVNEFLEQEAPELKETEA